MVSTFTSSNRFTKQGKGDNKDTWGLVLNSDFDLIDQSLDGVVSLDTSAGSATLSTANGASDQARNRLLKLIGAPTSAPTFTIPDQSKIYLVDGLCTTSVGVTIKNVSGTGVVIPSNQRSIVYCDGASTRSFYTSAASGLLPSNNLSDLTNVSAALGNLGVTSVGTSSLTSILTTVYPVGSVYINAVDSTNPATLLGFGVWVALGEGQVLLGAGTGTDVNSVSMTFAAGATGGEYTHILTTPEIPAHTHGETFSNSNSGGSNAAPAGVASGSGTITSLLSTLSTGGGGAHNNIQPYITVYLWKRNS